VFFVKNPLIKGVTMKVLLIKDISGVGKKGEVKDFADGYAKNYLIAKGFARLATQQIISSAKNEELQQKNKKEKIDKRNLEFKSKLDGRTFTFVLKTGANKQLFGSVHEQDVVERIKSKLNIDIEKRNIILPKQMKQVGEYECEVKIVSGVSAKIKINITSQGNE
jgi:large subunit ribosomal protein L9